MARTEYLTFADECHRLAPKQTDIEDRKTLLRMAGAWLLVAELAHLHPGNGGDGS